MNSGPNQHYIPQFVQRPFGIPPKRHQIWYFECNELPEQKPIKRTGSQNNFYSSPAADGRPTLDDKITTIESRLSLKLHNIRSEAIGECVDPDVAAAIIAHLAPRTAHIRDILKRGLAQILDHASVLFTDSDKLQALVGLDCHTPNDRFREYIFGDLISRPEIAGLNLPTHVLERVAFYFAKENVSEFLGNTLPLLRPVLNELLSGSSELVRNCHNKALVETVKFNPRESFLRTLSWTIESAPKTGAILPDCVVIAFDKDDMTTSLMFVGQDEIRAVIMPLSPEKLLVGRKIEYKIPQDFNYNVDAVRASYSFFLSSYNNAESGYLHSMIAERPTSILEEVIGGEFRKLLPELSPPQSENKSDWSKNPYSLICPTTSKFQCEVSFIDCEDQETAQRINDELQGIVSALSRTLPLGRLDGITIANDYPAALRALDRGFDNAPPVETVSLEVGVGVAQMVTVMRSVEVKGRIIMSNTITHALISDNAAQAGLAINIVVRELALVAMIEFIESALPSVLLRPVEGEFNSWLYANVDSALHGYIASWIAAGFGDHQELADAKRQRLVASVNRMKATVLKERLAYRYHGNLDELLAITLSSVRQVLSFAADLLGHCSFAEIPSFDDSDKFGDALEQAGLTNWLKMYQVDLERFHKRLGRWESFSEFLAFNVHVERLLWQLGMLPWEGPEGIRVEIPVGTDAAELLSHDATC